MTRRRLLALAASAAILGAACTGQPTDGRGSGKIPARNASEAALLPRFADQLPAMGPSTFERLLGQLEGTPVVLNFWGSWCGPCREEMPRLVAAHRELGDRVQFVGVDVLDSRAEAAAFMDEFDMTFPSVFDPPDAIKTALGFLGQPVTVFYARDGTFVGSWAGPIPGDVLRRNLRAIAG